VFISKGVSDEEYENELLKALRRQRNAGVSSVVFGDIFLENVRKYRERMLDSARFLWGKRIRRRSRPDSLNWGSRR
jgi:diphthamide synthase (EF-2-diphthine--ammonia ligase)